MVMDKLKSAFAGLTGKSQSAPVEQGHLDYMVLARGTTAYDTEAEVLAAIGAVGVKTLIWEYMVEAQAAYRWGFGHPALPSAMGYWQFGILDATTDFGIGMVSLNYNDHRRSGAREIASVNDTLLHGTTVTSIATASQVDKNSMQALPEGGLQGNPMMVGQDSYLQIWYTKIVAATAADHVFFTIPVTQFP